MTGNDCFWRFFVLKGWVFENLENAAQNTKRASSRSFWSLNSNLKSNLKISQDYSHFQAFLVKLADFLDFWYIKSLYTRNHGFLDQHTHQMNESDLGYHQQSKNRKHFKLNLKTEESFRSKAMFSISRPKTRQTTE